MSESDQGLVMKPLEGDDDETRRSFVPQDSLLEETKSVKFSNTTVSNEM